MRNKLFQEDGLHQIRHTAGDRHEMKVTIPADAEGRSSMPAIRG